MIRQAVLGGALAGMLAGAPVVGAAPADSQAVAARAGMLGLGVEYTYGLNDRIAIRAGLNGSQLGFDSTESGIEYAFDAVWDSFTVGVDVHPLKGPLRISVGWLRNDNALEARSRSAGDVTVGDHTYTPQEVGTLTAEVTFDRTTPFVGVGWDWSRKRARRFGMSFDIGILSQGTPRVTLAANGGLVSDPVFQDDIATERAELEDSLSGLDVLPFATLGFVFRF
jgi:hypothetical protein